MRSLACLFLVTAVSTTLFAQGPKEVNTLKDGAALTDPKEILQRADMAIKAVYAIRYQAVFQGTGFMRDNSPLAKGTVVLSGKSTAGYGKFRVEAKVRLPDGGSMEFTAGSDGARFFLIDPQKKLVYTGGGLSVAGEQRSLLAQSLLLQHFVHPNPFVDEIQAPSIRLKGTAKVGDQDCYEVYLKGEKGVAIWYFSMKDFLPRRLDRVIADPEGQLGAIQWVLTDLVVDPVLTEDPFRVVIPSGFTAADGPAP